MNEVWKTIPSTSHISPFGYNIIRLCNNGVTKNFRMARLVAQAFIPNPENKPEVNHIDGNKLNDCVENLEWNTRSENMRHADRTGLRVMPRGEDHPNTKLTTKKVKRIRKLYKQGMMQKRISKLFDTKQDTVSDIVNFKTWKHI